MNIDSECLYMYKYIEYKICEHDFIVAINIKLKNISDQERTRQEKE